ncbi:hypothetical protein EDC01DRAFT_629963 [Geopyxis carbonaria]|nr:hypothetical protein EDC01DRAFT_631208 [Geopyxis carbonaria]KAI5795225.1 hypothetical protein EDC01DRAFT_629963 [Geopyxis carbonaria]
MSRTKLCRDQQIQLGHNMLNYRRYFQRFAKLMGSPKQEDAGEKKIRRPNIHQGIHVDKYLQDYCTMMNCEVSVNETKHKECKSKAARANKVHVDKQIMIDSARKEAVRSVVNGDRINTHSEISSIYEYLEDKCPMIFDKVSPWSLDDEEIEETEQSVIGCGIQFANLKLSRALKQSTVKYPSILSVGSHMEEELKTAYLRDYDMDKDVLNMRNQRIFYRKKVFIISRATEKKLVLEAGRWISMKSAIQNGGSSNRDMGCIQALFTHTRMSDTRVFAIIKYAKFSGYDQAMDCSVYSYNKHNPMFSIIGLPMIDPEIHHFVPIMVPSSNTANSKIEEIQIEGKSILYWHNIRVANFL